MPITIYVVQRSYGDYECNSDTNIKAFMDPGEATLFMLECEKQFTEYLDQPWDKKDKSVLVLDPDAKYDRRDTTSYIISELELI